MELLFVIVVAIIFSFIGTIMNPDFFGYRKSDNNPLENSESSELSEMKIHEERVVKLSSGEQIAIIRVPDGWIYELPTNEKYESYNAIHVIEPKNK